MDQLITLKVSGPEGMEIPHIPALDAYIGDMERTLPVRIAQTPEKAPDWKPLNDFFLSETEE